MQRNEQSPQWLEVGFIKGPHGLRGELYVEFFASGQPWQGRVSELLLKPKDKPPVPQRRLVIESRRSHKNGMIIKPQELSTRTEAEGLSGWTVLLPTEMLSSAPGETIYLFEILGFEVFQKGQIKSVGRIVNFSSNGAQDLLVIESSVGGHTSEVPFVEAFIEAIHFDQRRLELNLPDGLLDLGHEV